MKNSSNENNIQKKERVEVSEYNPVPLYRSYGVTTREYPLLTKIKVFVQRVLLLLVFAIPLYCTVLSVFAVAFISGSALAPTVIFTPILVFVALVFTKPLRMRLKMIRELKKLCKKEGIREGYKLEMSDSPFSSKWSTGKSELVFHTNTKVYRVRMFAVREKRSKLHFESDKEITVVTPPAGKLAVMFGIETKQKKLTFDFSDVKDVGGKKIVNALVFCPGGEDWSYRKSEKTYIPTGNGGTVFGYNVYTAGGFVYDIKNPEE